MFIYFMLFSIMSVVFLFLLISYVRTIESIMTYKVEFYDSERGDEIKLFEDYESAVEWVLSELPSISYFEDKFNHFIGEYVSLETGEEVKVEAFIKTIK